MQSGEKEKEDARVEAIGSHAHTRTHTHTRTHIHARTHTHTHHTTHMHARTYVRTHAHTHAHVRACMHTHARARTHAHARARTHAHTHTHTHTPHTHTYTQNGQMDTLGITGHAPLAKPMSPGRHFRDYGPVQNKLLKPGQVHTRRSTDCGTKSHLGHHWLRCCTTISGFVHPSFMSGLKHLHCAGDRSHNQLVL